MSFTTLPFFLLLAAVLILYYFLPKTGQKILLLGASYVFYMWSVPLFGLLLLATTGLTYLLARLIADSESKGRQKLFLVIGCVLQLGLLFVLKYLNFAFALFRIPVELSLAVPLGISFFTFAVTGYLFDVYRGKIAAERHFLDYAVFVAFFPSLLAGPIGKAREFLPRLRERHTFSSEQVKGGILRFLFGMFQKMVLADTVALLVDAAYGGSLAASSVRYAFLLYPLQIYFDFAGYSNMALGVAQTLGFRLTENFDAPYLSTSVRSFWKKWHISLTDWFREYLYFPLGGSRKGRLRTYLNILIVFSVSGLWHGAAVTYLIWGALNGVLQVIELLLAPAERRLNTACQSKPAKILKAAAGGILTYLLIAVTWVFFRADSVSHAGHILYETVTNLFAPIHPVDLSIGKLQLLELAAGVLVATAVDIFRKRADLLHRLSGCRVLYYAAVLALVFWIALFGIYGRGYNPQDFIYFKY